MADLTVRGAGVFGLSIAWTALLRGARVCVVDPYGVGAGSSGGIVGALQPHTPDPWNDKKQFQLESLLKTNAFWQKVDAVSGQSSGYGNVGRLMPLVSDRDVNLARSRSKAAALRWGNAACWDVVETPGPWCPPSPTGFYVHDTLSAILHPRRAVDSLAAAILAKGAGIVTDAPDTTPTVWATGWQGLQDLSDAFGHTVGDGVKGQAAVLDFDAAGEPQLYADGLHFVPHLDGTLAIGSTTERSFDDAKTTDDQVDDLIQKARGILPDLKNANVLATWAGVRPRAKSRAPLLGPWPNRRGHFIANGGFKIGFGMAAKVAETMVDLVLDGRDMIPREFHTDLIKA